MKLYDFGLSGNCYKVRLLLSLLHVPYENVTVDLMKGEHRSPEYLALNPLGQVPVLVDESYTLRDSQAILAYLARRYDAEGQWYPQSPLEVGQVQSWLSLAANEVANGPATLRLNALFNAGRDEKRAREVNDRVLKLLEAHSEKHEWLVGERATIADVACYPYLKLAPDGGVDLSPYPSVLAWFARIEQLPGYVPLTAVATGARNS